MPQLLAKTFGLPIETATGRAYVRALGARDGVLGLLAVGFLRTHNRDALALTLGISALAGASDFGLVLRLRGTAAPPNLLLHAAGTLGLLAAAAAARRAPPGPDGRASSDGGLGGSPPYNG